MKRNIKIKAQAMQFALLVSVLVALLLSAFLLLTHVHSFFAIKSKELINGVTIPATAIRNFLATSESPSSVTDSLHFFIENQEVKISNSFYGGWTKITAVTELPQKKYIRTALSGSRLIPETPNLYLPKSNTPLVVIGNTRLEGNLYLSEYGIKAGNIGGKYYQGRQLYDGRLLKSKKTLPTLDSSWLHYISSLTTQVPEDTSEIIPLRPKMQHSFEQPQKWIYAPETIHLEAVEITGNIIIKSDTKIIVYSSAILQDVLLIAPVIELREQVRGRMHLLATKKLQIGKKCHLQYPSSVILSATNHIKATTTRADIRNQIDMVIDSKVQVEGVLLYLKKKLHEKERVKTHMLIKPETFITGGIYCQGNVDFQGVLKGRLYALQFIANQQGSLYLNHIYEARIMRNPIPDYAGLPMADTKKTVAKWLY
ncbi:hypothetical protein HN014_01025 [Aquimarina sp. TRL1]|uniref:hypothetical protein n=1 Tax=Aquimarina sp. (strain TRL1) TaxID=2736252 RepID=UPI00158BC6ED|nr:hypothetical protein [Aquimarina sp. TRL1]QKX03552.1 hypothetical protein HN014_01025 [Aquimarina sp. TRL1]